MLLPYMEICEFCEEDVPCSNCYNAAKEAYFEAILSKIGAIDEYFILALGAVCSTPLAKCPFCAGCGWHYRECDLAYLAERIGVNVEYRDLEELPF